MEVDDVECYKLKYPIFYLMCPNCHCSCCVQHGKIIDYTDSETETTYTC